MIKLLYKPVGNAVGLAVGRPGAPQEMTERWFQLRMAERVACCQQPL